MRCTQCGFEVAQGAAFCSRCGTRVMTPRPETRHEYALTRILPSWWHFFREILIGCALAAGGIYRLITHPGSPALALVLWAGAAAILGMASLARRYTSWSLTSDRLIARRGLIASHRREMELADVRSIEVDRGMMQRLLGLGNVTVASAASADFVIRLLNIPDPERVAEMLRQARLKRLA
jgi:membrane protein YdbS with pleckstrin-like domain